LNHKIGRVGTFVFMFDRELTERSSSVTVIALRVILTQQQSRELSCDEAAHGQT
jgi:hypothetical protein